MAGFFENENKLDEGFSVSAVSVGAASDGLLNSEVAADGAAVLVVEPNLNDGATLLNKLGLLGSAASAGSAVSALVDAAGVDGPNLNRLADDGSAAGGGGGAVSFLSSFFSWSLLKKNKLLLLEPNVVVVVVDGGGGAVVFSCIWFKGCVCVLLIRLANDLDESSSFFSSRPPLDFSSGLGDYIKMIN